MKMRISNRGRSPHRRFRQLRKLIPNTYIMRMYKEDTGEYAGTVLIQLSDAHEDSEGQTVTGYAEC